MRHCKFIGLLEQHHLTFQVITIILGSLKLWYTHWRVRKYTAIEKLATKASVIREKSIIRSLSTRPKNAPKRQKSHRYEPRLLEGNDVPFGIRALESGIAVEGVWDSRVNTPAGSRESSLNNIGATRQSATVDASRIERQQMLSQNNTSPSASATSSQAFARAVSAEILQSQPSSPKIAATRARSRYPPHSYARYNGSHRSKTTNTLGSLSTPESQRYSSNASKLSVSFVSTND